MQDGNELKTGRGRGPLKLKLGPLSESMLMGMAALTRDYHPLQLFPETAASRGLPGLRLHEAWIGGLVDLGLRELLGEVAVATIAVSYVRHAHQGDTLVLELSSMNGTSPRESSHLSFRILDQRRRVVAQGTAHMGKAS